MRKWASGGAAAVVTAAAVTFGPGPAVAAENEATDPAGDPVNCETGETLTGRGAGDITSVAVFESSDEGRIIIEVVVGGVIDEILEEQFSWAVLVEKIEQDGTVRQFLVEIHAGERRIGEVNPETGEVIESNVEVGFDEERIGFHIDQSLEATKTVRATAFNVPAEGDAKSCDEASPVEVQAEAEEPAAPSPKPPAADEGDGGGFPIVLVVFGVVVVVVVTGVAVWRRRVGPTVTDEDLGTVPEEPGIVLMGDFCDWSLYWEGSLQTTVIRRAEGKECCVYTLGITMTVERAAFAVQGRQDDPAVEGPGGRLRIPAQELDGSGLDLWGMAGARNGPAGTLDWMQGLGDAPSLAPGRDSERPPGRGKATGTDDASSLEPFSEPFDPSSSMDWQEVHVIRAQLVSECPDHENEYRCEGDSSVSILPGHECTNRSPGDGCPVRAPAVGRTRFEVRGGLDYAANADAGHAPQAASDHEHPDRPRQEVATKATADDANALQADAVQVDVRNEVVVGAGTQVPSDVWPTTDRVTAEIEAYLSHAIGIDGKMERSNACEAGGCCDGRECRCRPAFELRLSGGQGTLAVDGAAWQVFLDPPARVAGASTNWDVA